MLATLAFIELWERFAFFGMQALLILYMVGHLLNPGIVEQVWGFGTFHAAVTSVFGALTVQGLAAQIFGLYVGAANFLPLLGSVIGDRLGRRGAVASGLGLLTAGHFAMTMDAAFLLALLLIVCGCGLLKGNLAAQVGLLYKPEDSRREAGFAIYVWAVNLGALLAPLVCGTLGERYGWSYGFAAAGTGMLVALLAYLLAWSRLPADVPRAGRTAAAPLARGDIPTIVALLVVLAVAVLFWTTQVQVWTTYPLWVKARVGLDIGAFRLPVTWFQSLDAGGLLVLTPFVLWRWRRLAERGREPQAVTKFAIGCAIFAFGFVWLALADRLAGAGKVNPLWPTLYHVIAGLGFLFFVPVCLSIVSRAAPPAINGLMLAIFYCSLSLGSVLSGTLGRFYEQMTPSSFWLMHAAIVGCGSLILIVVHRPLTRALRIA